MSQITFLHRFTITFMLVIGLIAVSMEAFAAPKPTATDAQNFIKKMTLNKMISEGNYILHDYVIVAPCKSTWKYNSPLSIHTASVDWANITSIKSTGTIYIDLNGVVTITKEDKQKGSTVEDFKFPDKTTRDRAARAIQVLIDECDVLGDAFGTPIDE